jgi:hypothetical protein
MGVYKQLIVPLSDDSTEGVLRKRDTFLQYVLPLREELNQMGFDFSIEYRADDLFKGKDVNSTRQFFRLMTDYCDSVLSTHPDGLPFVFTPRLCDQSGNPNVGIPNGFDILLQTFYYSASKKMELNPGSYLDYNCSGDYFLIDCQDKAFKEGLGKISMHFFDRLSGFDFLDSLYRPINGVLQTYDTVNGVGRSPLISGFKVAANVSPHLLCEYLSLGKVISDHNLDPIVVAMGAEDEVVGSRVLSLVDSSASFFKFGEGNAPGQADIGKTVNYLRDNFDFLKPENVTLENMVKIGRLIN